MAYTLRNFKSKKALKEAYKAGEEIEVYQPGPFGPTCQDGSICLEGPHYPAPHTWYASATCKDGILTSCPK